MGLDFAKISAAAAKKPNESSAAGSAQAAVPVQPASQGAVPNRLASLLGTTAGRSQTDSGTPTPSAPGGPSAEPSHVEPEVAHSDSALESQEAAHSGSGVVVSESPAPKLSLNRALIGAPVASAPEPQKLDVIPPGPEGFAERLRRLDSLIMADNGVTEINIGVARTYVREVAIELKEHPEYIGIMKDLDIHNVMVFMRGTMALAEAGFAKKEATAEKKASKKAASAKFDFSGFDANLIPPPKGSAKEALGKGLDALANFDASSIPTLGRK